MNYYFTQVASFSIVIPAIIGWARFHKINPAFYPFLFLIWIGLINETISTTLVHFGYYNIVNFNVYLIIEALLILWQFKSWQLFSPDSKSFQLAIFVIPLIWLIENIFISKISSGFNSYSKIIFSLVFVFMSISMINKILMKERQNLLKHSTFLICIGFVFMFTYSLLVEIFLVYGLKMSLNFQSNLNHIFSFMNLFCNIIYAFAILWMTKRQAFTLQF